MSAPEASRQRAGRLLCTLVVGLLTGLLAGCGGAVAPAPTPSTPSTPTPSSNPTTPAPTVPADGSRLADLGFQNGPPAFTVPRGSVLSTVVDQPNNVVLVWSSPDPTAVEDYLRTALPATGFTVGEPGAGDTFTFIGHGWSGSVTSSGGSTAILLRPL